MANRTIRVSGLPTRTGLSGNNVVLAIDNTTSNTVSNTVQVSLTNLFTNSSVDFIVKDGHSLSANTLIIRRENTPANSTVTVAKGTFWYDANFLYIAVATDTIKRVALSSF